MTDASSLDDYLRGWLLAQQQRGYIRDGRIRRIDEHDALRLELLIFGESEWRSHQISGHEFSMGGLDALRYWLETVDRDIQQTIRRQHTSQYQNAMGRLGQAQQGGYAQQYQNMLGAQAQSMQGRTGMGMAIMQQQAVIQMQALMQAGLLGGISPKDEKAEKRAKELFVLASGKEAFDTLDAGNALALTGSKGGKYTLHKRATFCVERPTDGARLCAVVPGVPLWDHLLGIKLMIEHDEPKFLKTANVAGGAQRAQAIRTWYDEAIDGIRQSVVNPFASW